MLPCIVDDLFETYFQSDKLTICRVRLEVDVCFPKLYVVFSLHNLWKLLHTFSKKIDLNFFDRIVVNTYDIRYDIV